MNTSLKIYSAKLRITSVTDPLDETKRMKVVFINDERFVDAMFCHFPDGEQTCDVEVTVNGSMFTV